MDMSFFIKQMMPPDFDMDAAIKGLQSVASKINETHAQVAATAEQVKQLASDVAALKLDVGRILQLSEGDSNGR